MTPPSAPAGTTAPRRADGVELLGDLQGSGYAEARALVRRADGQTLQLTPLLYALLVEVDGHRSPQELAEALSARIGKTAAAEDVEHLLGKLEPLGVLAGDRAPEAATTSNPLLRLRFKVVVSDPAVTRRLTAPFAWLFRPWVVVPSLLAFAATVWFVVVEKGLAQSTRHAFEQPGLLLAVFALTVVSAGFHEFGHAAACRYAGATPGAMGAGLYVVWPAFYTDVDDSYRLPRRGRLLVDLGGLYFNALAAVAITVLWTFTRQDALLLGVATQLLQMLRQLAPVVRADGYHILADLTGVPDLFAHMGPTLRGLLPQHWGEPSPLRRGARVLVTTWVLVVVPVLLAMMLTAVLLLPRMAATAWASADRQLDLLAASFAGGDPVPVLARLLSLVALVLPVAATTYLLVTVVRRAVVKTRALTEGRPVARAAAALAGVALAALLGWAWWPDGQYEPVRADERGTIGDVLQLRPAAYEMPLTTTEQTAMALVPRDPSAPVLLLVRPSGGGPLQTVLTSVPSEPGGTSTARVLPFQLPDDVGEGGNSAVAVNTGDGTVVYDVAVALVKVVDGAPVTNRNEAYALASCQRCATVAVAFQVVLVVGQSDVQVPVNAAVAANKSCAQCLTTALAVQLVVTLRELPSADVEAQLAAAWGKLQGVDRLTADLDVAEVYARVQSVQAEVLDILVRSGLVQEAATTTTTSDPSATPSAGPSDGAASGTTVEDGAEPSSEPGEQVSPTAEPDEQQVTTEPSPEVVEETTSAPQTAAPDQTATEQTTTQPTQAPASPAP